MTKTVKCLINGVDYGIGGQNALRSLDLQPEEGGAIGLATVTLRNADPFIGDILDKHPVQAGEWDTTLNSGAGGFSWKWFQGTVCSREQTQEVGLDMLDWAITCQDANLALDRVGIDDSPKSILRTTDDTLSGQLAWLVATYQTLAGSPTLTIDVVVDSALDTLVGSLPDFTADNHTSLRVAIEKLLGELQTLHPGSGIAPRYYIGFASGTATFGNPTLYVYNGDAGPAGGITLDANVVGDIMSIDRLLDGTDKVEQRVLTVGGLTTLPQHITDGVGARNPYAGDGFWWGMPLTSSAAITFQLWTPNTDYTVGAAILPTAVKQNGHFYTVQITGTSGGSEPSWPTAKYGTVIDGTITWIEAGTTDAALGSPDSQLTTALQISSTDRETLRVRTQKRAAIGYRVDFSWSLAALSHVIYYVRQLRVTFEAFGKIEFYDLALGQKPLELGQTADGDVPALPVEIDISPPDPPGALAHTGDFGGKDGKVNAALSWTRPLADDLAHYKLWAHYSGADHNFPDLSPSVIETSILVPAKAAIIVNLQAFDYAGNASTIVTVSFTSGAGFGADLYNGSFAVPLTPSSTRPDGWAFTLTGSATAGMVAGGYDDATALQLYAPAASSFVATSLPFMVTPRQVLTVQLAHRSASHLVAAPATALAIAFYDQSGSIIGSATALGSISPGSDVWQLAVYEKVSVPANAVTAVLTISSTGTSTVALQVDAVQALATAVAGQTSGAISAGDQTKLDHLTGAGSVAVASGKTLSVSNSLTLGGTDGKALTLTGSLTVDADTDISGGGALALAGFILTAAASGTVPTLENSNAWTNFNAFSRASNAIAQFTNTAAQSATAGAGLRLYHDDGNPMGAGNRLGGLVFGGTRVTGAGPVNTGGIFAYATALWTSGSIPMRIEIQTVPTGSTTAVTRVTINADGQVDVAQNLNANGGITVADAKNIILGSTTGTKIGTATTQKLGFWNATPVARPAAYTLAGTLTRTFPTDPSGAYTGLATGLGSSPYAAVTDLNTLRTALSTLIGVVRQMATDLGSTTGVGLLNA